ncbi:NlpC/P60 family protein [Lentisphaera profundi]|uniref:NlpC/P60 family protein n=1 Tax=Lentisphaera profundi TaxID=1658616 RepID=A0ABY7VT52_9BACT|nr:NlpC/P60 family protein [Lentisphaera profundi]WDE96400.1 NlpC/P60 family protein [Lentisphaera profundi]
MDQRSLQILKIEKKQVLIIGLLACSCTIFYFQAINSKFYNLAFIILSLNFYSYLTYLSKKVMKWALLCVLLTVIIFTLSPAKKIDTAELKRTYLSKLPNYEGVSYVWGGENSLGIDCSGLARRAYRDALFTYTLKNLNSGALREFLANWWWDSSAEAMSQGYRDYLKPIGLDGTIKTLHYENLEPGDIAITADGVHMLVYLGEELWIQADPVAEKVIIRNGIEDKNSWFDDQVKIYRWSRI